jgi:hypothetical protein
MYVQTDYNQIEKLKDTISEYLDARFGGITALYTTLNLATLLTSPNSYFLTERSRKIDFVTVSSVALIPSV